jgi:Na+-transporting NADH:ubiquinone oxidoreductase subunit B
MWWGTIPGSIGETSKPLIIVGMLLLIATGVGSWRIIVSMLIGGFVMGMILNAWGATPFMEVPWYYQMYMGSFLFAAAFMATDPVTASTTNTGKWIYGFSIGFIGMIVRVMNPAYPEGWMLAILFLNTFAPLIDHYVLESNIKKRLKRA